MVIYKVVCNKVSGVHYFNTNICVNFSLLVFQFPSLSLPLWQTSWKIWFIVIWVSCSWSCWLWGLEKSWNVFCNHQERDMDASILLLSHTVLVVWVREESWEKQKKKEWKRRKKTCLCSCHHMHSESSQDSTQQASNPEVNLVRSLENKHTMRR